MKFNIFEVPMWRFAYPDWMNDREKLIRYATEDKHYINATPGNTMTISHANLHKDPVFKKMAEFMTESAKQAMTDCGLFPNIGMTSLWCTRQTKYGRHHFHRHLNSFLSGVIHMFDSNNKSSGTVFTNPMVGFNTIAPAVQDPQKQIFGGIKTINFEPGTFFMFPSWLSHYTQPNESDYRLVMATNFMPIGRSNTDHFDRYDYPDPETMELEKYDFRTV